MIYYILCIFTYLGPIVAWRTARAPLISPLTFAVIFYFTQFGPQALFHGFLRVARNPSTLHDHRFVMALAIANVAFTLGILLPRLIVTLAPAARARTERVTLVQTYRGSTVLLLVAAAYASIFIILDGPNIPQLREHLLFLFQESAYTYTEVRRILFADSLVSIVQGYTRQSATALLIAFLAITSLRVRWSWRSWFVGAILVVFVTAALQLNKFPFLYFLVCAAMGCYVFKKGLSIDIKGKVALLAGVPTLFLLLFGMYMFQYSEQLESGVIHIENLVSMIFYRPFMAESDALRLWFEEFPDRTPFLGVRNIDLLADLFGLEFVDVTRLIPVTYINKELTTFQTGFIGSGYASFGYPGIALYGLVVGAIAVAATALINRIREADVKAAFCGVLCLNMYFMFSRELATALLSGGIGPVFAMVLLYIAISGRTERRHAIEFPRGREESAPSASRQPRDADSRVVQ